MSLSVSRKRFLSLCDTARARCAGSRCRAWLDSESVKRATVPDALIEFRGSMSGASEGLMLTMWAIPLGGGGVAVAQLMVPAPTMCALASDNEMVLKREFDGRTIFG